MGLYRKDIDGLRAVAVIPVVLYHAGFAGVSGGFVGVDVFFVISGYLITGIIRDELTTKSFSLLGFYERRARRILPALFFMIAACFVASWFILMPDKLADFGKSVAATIVFSSNFWFWREASGGYFAEASEFLPLLHTWSLAVEEQFYLVFPLLLMWIWARGRAVTYLLIGGIVLASLAASIIAVERWPSAAFYLAPTRMWELGLGALATGGDSRLFRARLSREIVAAAGLGAILAANLLYDKNTPFPGFAALLPCLGATAIIVVGSSGKNLISSMLSWRPLVFFGTISYSLYLWHWPILSFLRSRLQTLELSLVPASAAVVGAVIAATVSWAIVERPFRNRAFLGRSAIFALSATSMTVAMAFALVVWAGSGIPSRIPAEAITYAAAMGDTNPLRGKCFETPDDTSFVVFHDPCHLGTETVGPVDFLFWGDSHSDALFPGMDRAARLSGWSGVYFGGSACPPILSLDRFTLAGIPAIPFCRPFNENVLSFLRGRSDIGTVILYSRWAYYQTGEPIKGEQVTTATRMTDDENPLWRPGTNALVFERGMQKTVGALIASGRRVVILGGTPEFGWNVPEHLFASVRFGDPIPAIPNLSDVAQRNAGVGAVFAKLQEDGEVSIVPLAPVFCSPQCSLTYRGEPLFVDDDHMSAFAARELVAPYLVKELFDRIAGAASSDATPAGSPSVVGAEPR